MARARKPNPRKGRKGTPKQKPRNQALDTVAINYAKLLVDPCAAPLAHPIYPGSDAGFLFRAESFIPLGETAGTTAAVFHWTPGYVNASNTECLFINAGGSGTSVAATATAGGPGKTFLNTNAKAVRCVAACLRFTYAGLESARSGRVHYGHTSAGMIDLGQSITADSVAQTLQHYSRTPADTVEIVWKPNVGDFEFNDPTEAPAAQTRDRKSSITVSLAGLPTAVGVTIHLTAVYEWTPAVGLGVSHNALGKARSRNSMDDVMDTVIRSGFSFVRNTVGHAGQSIGVGLASGISSMFGIMPSRPMMRTTRYLMS